MNPRSVLPLVLLSGWVLWHDIGVYRAAAQSRLGGPTYQVTAFETEGDCTTDQRAAMEKEERPRVGPMTERLPDGIKVWDRDRQHYTTFRYFCRPAGAGSGPFQTPPRGGRE